MEAKRLVSEAEKWRAEMRKKGAKIRVLWITGPAGTGKTSLAKDYAEKKGQPYFITGSSRDIFQNYAGEHTLIIDELRPKMLTYSDLLRITDPHGIDNQVMMPCRYNDKALACDLIIITTPFTPSQFYYYQTPSHLTTHGRVIDDSPDAPDQLYRRITVTIEMTGEQIEVSRYDIRSTLFVPVEGTARPNPYSKLSRPAPLDSDIDFFNSMFDD